VTGVQTCALPISGPHLRADIEKLRDNRKQKMRITKELAEMSSVAGLIFVLASNGRKFGPQDEHPPYKRNRPDYQIRFNNTQRFRAKIRFVSMLRLSNCDFLRC